MQFFDNEQIDKMFKNYDMSKEEMEFIKNDGNVCNHDINQTRMVSEMYLSKTIYDSIEKLIRSNEKLAESNEKYSKKIVTLTWVLVFVGIIQAVCATAQIIILIRSIML